MKRRVLLGYAKTPALYGLIALMPNENAARAAFPEENAG